MPSLLVTLALLLGVARAQSGPDANQPAAEPDAGSLWDYIEPAEGSAAPETVRAATEELAQERLAEQGDLGGVAAGPPVEYYLDPIGATDRDPLHLDRVDPSEFDIPVVVNEHVVRWMEYFLGRGRKYYARYLERSTKWTPLMYRQIDQRGLPRDLIYLSMIESGFSPGAYSYASAVGLWQFMSYTGRQYGLRIDWWVDDRRDPEKATRAALDYLSYLNQLFDGDWWLAWASYNGGEGRVMSATRRSGSTDFWKIIQYDYLHTETENYVPKLIAAALIGKHPERYGFVGIKYQPEFRFDTVEVPASTSLEVLARCAGVNEEQLLDLNPALRRWALPPDPETQSLRIPPGTAVAFREAFAKVPPSERVSFQRHVVKRGESLGTIARKYGVSVEDITRVNHLKSSNKITVGMELIIPVAPASAAAATASASAKEPATTSTAPAAAKAPAESAPVVTTYTVRAGDTLAGIARAKGVSLTQLQEWNGIRDENTIYVGQKLTLKKPSGSATPAAPSSAGDAPAPAPSTPKTYTVRSGDTLSTIAQRHGVTVDQLKSWNRLSGSTILVGQTLKVSGGSSSGGSAASTLTYVVRRGDSLGAIAERYNCTVAELKSWNNLSGSTIYPGQKLTIRVSK